ncbi:hypothetical protein [Oscillibacter sp. GMB15532]|uniref:hypothetical protein n=1 Tax=Oscillibacter sp. GMB15532 TaxID=3230022 RepID=UPI0034DF3417
MKDDASDSAMHMLSDIRHILLGIALMIAGVGSILFSMAIVHDFFLGLGGVLLLCGLVKVVGLWLGGSVDTEAVPNADHPESTAPGVSSNEPITQKED